MADQLRKDSAKRLPVFREAFPGIELRLRGASRAEGLRLLEAGESELHCGGLDAGTCLPGRLRRVELPALTMGIVAHRDHPLQPGGATVEALADWPWVDCIADLGPGSEAPSLNELLDRLHARTGRRGAAVVRAGAAGLALIASGPYLAWLPLELLARLPGRPLSPLPLTFGRRHCPTGLVLRRSVEGLAPVRAGGGPAGVVAGACGVAAGPALRRPVGGRAAAGAVPPRAPLGIAPAVGLPMRLRAALTPLVPGGGAGAAIGRSAGHGTRRSTTG